MAQTVLVTGASHGIGAAAARAFAAQGCRVAVNYYRSETEAEALASEIGGIAVRADVANRDQVSEMIQTVADTLGPIEVLVNNAAIAGFQLFTDLTEEEWSRMLAVNLTGAFHCAQAVVPGMIHRKQGKIINVSSIWGLTGASFEVAYSASKAGLIGMTKALAKELGPSNIQVNCVAPGVVDTKMNASLTPADLESIKEETPLGVIGRPEDIAQTITFLASSAADFITGQVISPNGGFVI